MVAKPPTFSPPGLPDKRFENGPSRQFFDDRVPAIPATGMRSGIHSKVWSGRPRSFQAERSLTPGPSGYGLGPRCNTDLKKRLHKCNYETVALPYHLALEIGLCV